MNGQTDRQTDRQLITWSDKQTDKWLDGQKDG